MEKISNSLRANDQTHTCLRCPAARMHICYMHCDIDTHITYMFAQFVLVRYSLKTHTN